MNEIIEKVNQEYSININQIEKNEESTVGNVYMLYSKGLKFVVKIYDDLNHVKSMIYLHRNLYNNKFNVPKIINSKNNVGYIELNKNKYLVIYSFLEGVQLGKIYKKLPNDVINKVALQLKQFHDLTSNTNIYNLKDIPIKNKQNIKRYSALHFDFTKMNLFLNNQNKIGIIDFDDAKYGPSICDVAIAITNLFFSKTNGVDIEGVQLFIDSYYKDNLDLKQKEISQIKFYAIEWINYIMNENEFDTSMKDSFIVKKQLIDEYLNL